MANESPRQAKARKLVHDKRRTREAAAVFRKAVADGVHAGMPAAVGDQMWKMAAIIDTAGIQMEQLPDQHRRAVLEFVTGLLGDEKPKTGPTPPLSAGDGV